MISVVLTEEYNVMVTGEQLTGSVPQAICCSDGTVLCNGYWRATDWL